MHNRGANVVSGRTSGKVSLLLLLVALLTVAALSPAALAAGGEVIIAKDQEAVGFDPHTVPAASSIQIYQHLFNRLVRMDEHMNIVPDLAIDWEQVDETTFVFTLRSGVKFHNGREMTAEDVKYSFERILDPETASIARSYFQDVAAIEAQDDNTVVFRLARPYAEFMTNLTTVWASIVPREVVEEHGDLMRVPVGTGPFMLAEWVPDNYTLLVRNPDYFVPGEPAADALRFLIMKEESARIAALRTGRVHITSITADAVPLLERQAGVDIITYPSLDYTYWAFNVTEPPFNDPRVRLAMSYAIDRQAIADFVYAGQAEVTGPVAPGQVRWALPLDAFPSYTRDLAKARELLAEAGYPNGFSTTIKTAGTYQYMIDTAVAIQSQIAEVGVVADIELVEWGQYIDAWSNLDHTSLVGLNGSGTTPDRALHFFFHTDGTANVWGYSNAEFDRLVEDARVTLDQDARWELYARAQEITVNEQAPNLFLNSPYNFYAVRSNVKGFTPTSITGESSLRTTYVE